MRRVEEAKHDEKRRQILKAAKRCFIRDGFRGASISDICAEARISPGLLYHYFENKEAIVGAMTAAGLALATRRISTLMQSANSVTALIAELERVKTRRDRASQLILDMLAEAGRNPAIGKILRTRSRAIRGLLTDFLRNAQKQGQVDRTLDAELAAALIISIVDGATAMKIRDPKLDTPATRKMQETLITRFLSPRAR